jgi:hypothetical protein
MKKSICSSQGGRKEKKEKVKSKTSNFSAFCLLPGEFFPFHGKNIFTARALLFIQGSFREKVLESRVMNSETERLI